MKKLTQEPEFVDQYIEDDSSKFVLSGWKIRPHPDRELRENGQCQIISPTGKIFSGNHSDARFLSASEDAGAVAWRRRNT